MQATVPNWTEQQIQSAWDTAEVIGLFNPQKWRKDICGAWISRDQYGNKNSPFGWRVEGLPVAQDGAINAAPHPHALQWRNAESQIAGQVACRVTAYGGENVELSTPVRHEFC